MKSLTPESKLLEQLKKYANRSRWPSEVLNELKESINAVAVDHRCSILATRFKQSETILHRAACKGEIDVFRLVIDSVPVEGKFDLLKVQNAKGNTPLHLVGLEFGDNIQHVLAGLSQENVAELLRMQNCNKQTLLHEACKADTSAPLEYLLSLIRPEHRFDLLKFQDKDGGIPLYYSVIDGGDSENKVQSIFEALSSEESFQLLQLKDNYGYTVLHKASEFASLSKLKLLLEHKNLSLEWKTHLFQLQTVTGDTLLHCVCCNDSLEAVKYIVDECPPDVRIHLLKTTNMDMRNPLHVAAVFQPAIVIKPLLANLPPSEIAAILSMKDSEGDTALTSAVEAEAITVVREITNLIPTDYAMSILNITNNKNKTAMEIAVGDDNQSAVSLLQKCADKVKILSTDDITYNSLVQSGSKRAAPLETATQPVHVAKTARVDHANEGRVQGQTLKIMYQGQGYRLPFKRDSTVNQLTNQIEEATKSACTFKDQDGFIYTKDITLDLIETPFAIFLDDVKISVTEVGEKMGK